MKALVIGGTGPTGPLVVRGLLDRRYDVTILHSGRHEVEMPGDVKHLHGDAFRIDSLKETLGNRAFDIILGMYGRLRHVADAVKGKTARFIAIGGAPYRAFIEGENSQAGAPLFLKEDEPLFRDETKNRFTYQMTVSEDAVMDAHRAGCYRAVILRFPMVYGPRQVAPREWSIIRRALDCRKCLIIPDGGLKLERRGYAENVAHSALLTLDRFDECSGEIFNVGDETVLDLKEWVRIIADTLNHKFEFVNMPFSIARPSRPYAGRNFHCVMDIGKIMKKTGYRDQFPARDGLKKTVEYYLENRPEAGGELEKYLGDPFNYASEDRFISEFRKMEAQIRGIEWNKYKFIHAYGSSPK